MKKDCRQQWWKDAKYGLFIHWGLYSQLAGSYQGKQTSSLGEWIMKHFNIPVADYEKIACDFNPTGFNADEWVELAKDAGMEYIVITAKHHDGFAMYHSKCSKYNIVDATPFGRDPIAELAVSCKREGIRLCFYYSQAQDWHEPNGLGYGTPNEEKDFDEYLQNKCKPQLKELLTQYGDVGLIWFDTPQTMSFEQSKEVKDYVKSIQPDCIVSGRIGNTLGEYMSTGDNQIPILPYDGDWEVPATLNDTWGYKSFDNNWKSPEQVLRLLFKVNGRGGNYLLNVGPDDKGVIPQGSVNILREVGHFVRANGRAIYATQPVWGYPYEADNYYMTSTKNHLYIHVLKGSNIGGLMLSSPIKNVTMLADGAPVEYSQSFAPTSGQGHVRCRLPESRGELCRTVDFELETETPQFGSLDNL
ncbi:MAG: alpha-L-fucosidase [Oscillospiraceae bacterium]|jgi:alpha-L-fucosidase|nr:alpha-L-fucosidase [Oscillospiraceae bacterium]